jgi:predicted peptidase
MVRFSQYEVLTYLDSMKFTIPIFCMLTMISATSLFAQNLSAFEKKVYIAKKDTLPYRILFPEGYSKTKKYPLVLFLHGSGERGSDNEKQLTHGMKLFADSLNRIKYPCIVIAPQCPANKSWNSATTDRSVNPPERVFNYAVQIPRPLELAIELTKSTIIKESVDKNRVYIVGLSMGGMGTFEAVYRYPTLFKAAVPICGGGDTKSYSKTQAAVDFWVLHGDKDGVVDVKYSQQMVARLKELNATVKYTEYPGVGHNSWTNAFAEPEFLSWLLKDRK